MADSRCHPSFEAPPLKRSRETGSTKDTSQTGMFGAVHVDTLPDSLLGSILSRLGPRERVRVEGVSKRWLNISSRYAWRDQTSLDETMLWDWKEGDARPDLSEIIYKRLKCLLARCSDTLRQVRLSRRAYDQHLDHTAIELIVTAKNIESLKIEEIPLTFSSAALIGRRLPNLKFLLLKNCLNHMKSPEAEHTLTVIFVGCHSLEDLVLCDLQSLTGEISFAHLPTTLRSLAIPECPHLGPSVIEHLGVACKQGQLRQLDISLLPIDSPVLGMGRLFEELPLLEELCYDWITDSSRAISQQDIDEAMAKIATMKKLRSLQLFQNVLISDEILRAISYGCGELEELVFAQWHGKYGSCYSSAGLRYLGQLPKLTSLTLRQIQQLDEETLLAISDAGRLRKLDISQCWSLNIDAIIQGVLSRCDGLRELDITSCGRATRATVKAIGDFAAATAAKMANPLFTVPSGEQNFQLRCADTSIVARPGALKAELLAAHPMLKCVRQCNDTMGKDDRLVSLEIHW